MENIIKSAAFWVLRFFDCLFSKRYWLKKILPSIGKSLYEFAVYLVESLTWIFFIIVTISTVAVCLIPGIIFYLGDRFSLSSFFQRPKLTFEKN